MDKLKKILFKPITLALTLLAVLPITPIIACLLYGWIY